MSGDAARFSTRKNAAALATAISSGPMTAGEVQP